MSWISRIVAVPDGVGDSGLRRRWIRLMFSVAIGWLAAVSSSSAVCLSTGKSCGVSAPANDRLCCPGMVCGWGNVCQAGCRINGIVYQSGATNPLNACQSCRPSISTTAWTSSASGAACNDGSACTYNDRCANGTCAGSAITCTSGPCITRTCNGTSSCTVTALTGNACNDGDACTYNDQCASGVCGGTSISCATDSCNARACNGTASCTVTPVDCSDDNPCTQDSCDPAGGCVHVAVSCGICGDGFCDGLETALSCCTDCGCPQGACVNNICPCQCVVHGDCLTQTSCSSNVNCNANGFCAP